MNMQDRLRGQSLPRLASLHMPITLELRLKRLDMRWSKLTDCHLPNPWRNLALNKLAMTHGCLARHPALNINREPMLQIFRNGHLCWIDVSPFVASIKQAI